MTTPIPTRIGSLPGVRFMTTGDCGGRAARTSPPGDGIDRGDASRTRPAGRCTSCSPTPRPSTSRAATWPSARTALEAIGGFDPRFRTAGDDVDICWRLQERGGRIGFHAGAMVWHHRRNSVRTYWRQQRGYGKAEALLERKWPEKYNATGHLSWAGRLYGRGLTASVRRAAGRVYHGHAGTALFQSVYQPAPGLLASLPLDARNGIWRSSHSRLPLRSA